MKAVAEMSGLGEFGVQERRTDGGAGRRSERADEGAGLIEHIYYTVPGEKVFLVERAKTLEVRCDEKLGRVLREKYETVMVSRYFGRGGIEIVPSGQLTEAEIEDLVRLSYNLSREMAEKEGVATGAEREMTAGGGADRAETGRTDD